MTGRLPDGVRVVYIAGLLVTSLLVAGSFQAAQALFTDAAGVTGNSFSTGQWVFDYYLHNNPTPPTGNTVSQTNLPLTTVSPSAATLYNYDTNRDAAAGLLVIRGASGPDEADTAKYQNWRTGALSQDLTISGDVVLTFWSGTQNFAQNKRGSVSAYLRDFDGSTLTVIAYNTLTVNNWQGGSSTWVQYTLTLPGVSYTVPAGHQLDLRLYVPGPPSSQVDMWFAYDTVAYPSRLTIRSN